MAKFNERLQFILDMSDKLTGPATKATKSLKGLGADVVATQKKLAAMNKQAGDISKLAALRGEVERNGKTSKELADKVGALKVQIAMTEKPTKAMRDALRAAVKEQTEHGKVSDKARDSLYKLDQQLKRAGVDTSRLGEAERKARIQAAQFSNELRRQSEALDRATKRQEEFTKAKERYAKQEQLAQKMGAGGAKVALAGAAVLGGQYAAGSPFKDFDAQMSAVQATGAFDDKTKERLAKLARDEAKISAWGATDVAKSQEFLAMAGYSADQIVAAQRGILNLASATNTGLAETADIASNIQSGFGLGADEIGRIGDILTKVTSTANTNLVELGGAMKYVAPVAKAAGYEIESVAAAAGMMANVGIKDSQAGTALRAAITRMAALPKAAKKAFDELGVATKDAAGNMRPLEEVLADVAEKTEGMGTGDKTALIAKMFGVEASAGLGELLAKSTGAELRAYIEKLRNSAGATDTAAATRLKNLDGDIKVLRSGIEEVQLKYGETFDKMYRGIIRAATAGVAAIDKWMAENPKLVKALGLVSMAIGAILSVVGVMIMVMAPLVLGWAKWRLMMWMWSVVAKGVLGAIWRLIAGVVMMTAKVAAQIAVTSLLIARWVVVTTVMTALRVAMAAVRGIVVAVTAAQWLWNAALTANPIGAVVMAVAALVAGGIWLYQNWDKLPELFDNLWAKVSEFVGFDPLAALSGVWDAVGDYFSDLFGGIWDKFMSVFGGIKNGIKDFGNWALGGFGFFEDNPELKEQVNDAPKPGETDPKVNGKPATKGNQIPAPKQVVNTTNQNTYQITIDAKGLSAQEVAEALDRKMAEAQRLADQKNRGRMND
ncbi:putative tail tape measure protein [Aeromonas phage Ahp2]|nr:putative tail tape measure protein [Aeromonas phage Ahp2]